MPILYVTKMTQNKNDSINSCYWQQLSCIIFYFKISKFDLGTIKIFLSMKKSLAVKASKDYKKQYRTLQSLRKNKNNSFIIFIRSIST